MDSGSTSQDDKSKIKKIVKNNNLTTATIGTFGSLGSTEPGKLGSLKGSKLTFKPKVPARRKQIKTEEKDKPRKSRELKGKRSFRDKKPKGRPTYEPSILSGPFAQGAARPGLKKEYGSGQSFSGSGGGIRVEDLDEKDIKPTKSKNLSFNDLENTSDDEIGEEDKTVCQPISLIDLTNELNEKMEKIRLEEKSFKFEKIKFEEEEEEGKVKIKKEIIEDEKMVDNEDEILRSKVKIENADTMETEETNVVIKTEPGTNTDDSFNTYSYPASDLLRNDIKPEENILFFQFPSVLPKMENGVSVKNELNAEIKTDELENNVKIETSDGNIAKVNLDTEASEPEGKMGKLLVYKSGKMKIKLGDVLFDVNPGTDCNFYQNAFSVDAESNEGYILGNIRKRFVCTPDLDSLL